METHLEPNKIERAKSYFSGFDLFFKHATRIHRYGRAIGGCLIGISKHLHDTGISYEVIDIGETPLLKLYTMENTYSVIPQYLRPANWDNDFEKLAKYFQDIEIQNPILIGDFNVRIGETNQNIGEIYKSSFCSGYDCRKSRDKTVNQKGVKFIQLCDNYNMLILNGITKGDEDGKLTYITALGESVNDICAVSKEILGKIEEFRVEDKVWSDHFPILTKINIEPTSRTGEKMSLLPKLIWKDEEKDNYQRKINESIRNIAGVNHINLNDINQIIVKSASKLINHKKPFEPKNKWYNKNCNNARMKSFKLLKVYRTTRNLEDKRRYIVAQKEYKTVCSTNKSVYYNTIANKLNNIKNSKEWWKMAKEIRNQCNLVGSNITPDAFKSYYENLLNKSQETTLIHYAPPYKNDMDLDRHFTMSELQKMLVKVKRNKAPGEDRIPYEFFINGTEEFNSLLLRIYNTIYSSGEIDPVFTKTIIYPIHKKGDLNEPSNYRGISFMNCVAKLFMGLINERLYNWVENYQILTEYQAGFRKNYSTVDNIYNLASIVHLKLAERKKVYCFFIDFKAAFDNISRQALIYKLFRMGVSYKMVSIIEKIYSNTQSAVWNGRELSEYFETTKGVKQGCLLSPLLFALYVNDLHEFIEGGLFVENINIRLLLYADDIVFLADDIKVLQKMIDNLEIYCKMWSLEVNLAKSEIMVFRNGGKLSKYERWMYNGREIKISNEFKYLGVVFTPKMKFNKHVQTRNNEAKNAINATWNQFIGRADIDMNSKWKLFLAVCRSIQTYAAEIWGFSHFEEINALQRYFLKRILRVPSFTPNYVLMLETEVEDSQIYTLGKHLNYLGRILYYYTQNRLPNQLSEIIYQKNIFWVTELKDLSRSLHVQWPQTMSSQGNWNTFCNDLLSGMKQRLHEERLYRKQFSQSWRIYRYLNPSRSHLYLNRKYSQAEIVWIFKARSGMIPLGCNSFDPDVLNKECKLCNMHEIETMQHFLGICPILREFRMISFGKPILNDEEIINILDGTEEENWHKLINYLEMSYKYRQLLINEFN